MMWHVICVRTKDAQKQLARTSLRERNQFCLGGSGGGGGGLGGRAVSSRAIKLELYCKVSQMSSVTLHISGTH